MYAATAWPNNAAMIAEGVVPLGYLHKEWPTVDATYGLGRFWTRWRPDELVCHDIDRTKGDGVDFRKLPHDDESFQAVVLDGPYKCVSLDTEILTRRGWATWDTVKVGEDVYTLNHGTGQGQWKPVKRVVVKSPAMRRMVAIEGKSHSSLSTIDHRWPVISAKGFRRWATSGTFVHGHSVPLCALSADQPPTPSIPDAMVELVAWFWTEGHIKGGVGGSIDATKYGYGDITQSHVVNPLNCKRIAAALEDLYGPPLTLFPRQGTAPDGLCRWRVRTEGRNLKFIFSAGVGRQLLRHAPNKVPSPEFLGSLTLGQLRLFIDASIDADGTRSANGIVRLTQKVPAMANAFQMACVLGGIATSQHYHPHLGHSVELRQRRNFRPLRNTVLTVDVEIPVWCIEVDNHTWLARRNGFTYFTGNCNGTTSGKMDNDYGVHVRATRDERHRLIMDGMTECERVLAPSGYLLVKCMDQVEAGQVRWQTDIFTRHGESLGLVKVDRLDFLSNPRPQPARTRADGRASVQGHARRNSSALLIFEKPKRSRRMATLGL